VKIRRVGDAGCEVLKAFLRADPVANIYLLGLLETQAPSRLPGTVWAAGPGGAGSAPEAAVYCSDGGLLVPAGERPLALEAAGAHVARLGSAGVKILVGPLAAVDPVWWCLGRDAQVAPPRLRRRHLLLNLERDWLQRSSPRCPLRPAGPPELEDLLRCAAAMRLEELGDDILATNPSGFRRWLRRRVASRRCWILRDSAGIAFKVDVGSVCAEGVQIEGVYTRPDRRGEGLCTRALRWLCESVLQRYPRATLHVWEHNQGARRVYDRLGFRLDRPYRVILR